MVELAGKLNKTRSLPARLMACSKAALNVHCEPADAKSVSHAPSAALESDWSVVRLTVKSTANVWVEKANRNAKRQKVKIVTFIKFISYRVDGN